MLSQLGRVVPQQVVAREPARLRLVDQVRPGQFRQQRRCLRQPQSRKGCRAREADVRARHEPEQPEQPQRRGAECLAGVGEHRTQVRGDVIVVGERVEVGQLVRQCRQRELRLRRRPCPGDREGQRQAGAAADHDVDGLRFGLGAVVADAGGQQLTGVVGRQQAQRQRPGAVRRPERGAARDHHVGVGRARQQRFDLVGVGRVVQHHQHPLAGERVPQQLGLPGQVVRHLRPRHVERRQEPQQRVTGAQRRAGGPEAVQVHVELTVREPFRRLMGPVHGERGLADATGAGDHDDAVRCLVQLRQLQSPARERFGRGGQLPWCRGGLQAPVQGGELPGRFGAQFGRQPGLEQVEVLQRVGRAAAAVQRLDQLGGDAFVQRSLCGKGVQLGYHRGVLSRTQPRVEVVEARREQFAGERGTLLPGPRSVHRGQQVLAGESECLGGPAGAHEVAEQVQVDLQRIDPDHVATRLAFDQAGQRLPQPGQPRLRHRAGAGRRRVAEDAFDQFVGTGHPSGVDEQHPQQRSQPGRPELGRAVVHPRRDPAEHREPHVDHRNGSRVALTKETLLAVGPTSGPPPGGSASRGTQFSGRFMCETTDRPAPGARPASILARSDERAGPVPRPVHAG